jgi:hypothetical protein
VVRARAVGFHDHALEFQAGQVQPQRVMGKPTSPESAGAPMIYHPSKCQDLPIKQAQIEPKKAKRALVNNIQIWFGVKFCPPSQELR